MTGKVKGNLFLTNSERDDILDMADAILESEHETMQEWDTAQRWAKILYSLVFGKKLQGNMHYPIVLVRSKDASTD